MKLKWKLITSFTTVTLITLGIFGVIVYYTFNNAIIKDAENIIKSQGNKTILTAHNKLQRQMVELLSGLSPNTAHQDNNLPPTANTARQTQILRSVADKEPLINAIYIYNNKNELIPQLATKHKNPSLFAKIRSVSTSTEDVWFIDHKKLYLLLLREDFKNKSYFLVDMNRNALYHYLSSLLTIDGSIIYLSKINQLFLPPITRQNSQAQPPSFKTIPLRATVSLQESKPMESWQIYRPHTKLFGTTVTFLTPKTFFTPHIILLRNRIILAMLVAGWCAIWIIFIMAHTITKPIRKLAKLSQDIIDFKYSSKLELKPSKDEIGELAVNFEIMRLKIKDLATRDQLTNVYNRRFLMHIFELSVLKALRLDEHLSCIIIDIDHLKDINIHYGHQAGDAVLVAIGKKLLDHTRDYDTPARYGGEEFILILPDTNLKTAYEIAERIRKAVSKMIVRFEGQQITCTLSIGLAGLDKHTTETTEQIINNADATLYKAKENGRNQTVMY